MLRTIKKTSGRLSPRKHKDAKGPEGLTKEEAESQLKTEFPTAFDHIEALYSDTGRQQILELLAKKELHIDACVYRVQEDPYTKDFYIVVGHQIQGYAFFRELVKSCDLEYVIQVLQAGLEVEGHFLLHTSYLIGKVEHAETVMLHLLRHFPFNQESLKSTLISVCCHESSKKLELLDSLVSLIEDINSYKDSDPIREMVIEDTLDAEVISRLLKAGFDMKQNAKFISAPGRTRRVDLITKKVSPVVLRDICALLVSNGIE